MKSFAKILAIWGPIAMVLLAPLSFAADKGDPAFGKWWQKFQSAVAKRDVRAIDKGVEFPLDWQISSDVRAIRDESDFAANFLVFFPPEIIQNIAAGKPEKLATGNYVLVWKANGKDYSLNFRPLNGSFVMDSLIAGKP